MSPLRLLGAAAMFQLLVGCGPRNNTNARTDSTDGRGDDATTYSGDRSANNTTGTTTTGNNTGTDNTGTTGHGTNINGSNDPTGRGTMGSQAAGSQGTAAQQGLGAGGDVNRNSGIGARDTDNAATGTQG